MAVIKENEANAGKTFMAAMKKSAKASTKTFPKLKRKYTLNMHSKIPISLAKFATK